MREIHIDPWIVNAVEKSNAVKSDVQIAICRNDNRFALLDVCGQRELLDYVS